jgi:hypothetical protein
MAAPTLVLLADGSHSRPSQPVLAEVELDEEVSVLSDEDFEPAPRSRASRMKKRKPSKKRYQENCLLFF